MNNKALPSRQSSLDCGCLFRWPEVSPSLLMRGVVLIFLKAVMQSLVSHLSLFKICVVGKAVSFPSHTDSSLVVAV